MKLKYYLRGAGVGILVTTLIFIIALAFHEPELSDEEIQAKAKQLGMVMTEEETSSDDNNANKTEEDGQSNEDETDGANTAGAVDTDTTSDGEPTEFVINSGEDSAIVVQHLYEAGLIDNQETFNTYLNDNNLDNLIQPGMMQLKSGMSYEEIANVIITKQENRTTQ